MINLLARPVIIASGAPVWREPVAPGLVVSGDAAHLSWGNGSVEYVATLLEVSDDELAAWQTDQETTYCAVDEADVDEAVEASECG